MCVKTHDGLGTESTGYEFSVAPKLLASAQVGGPSVIREWCEENKAWDSRAERGTGMRGIATFSGPGAPDALTARVSVVSHDCRQ
jgi:hypothetical protein